MAANTYHDHTYHHGLSSTVDDNKSTTNASNMASVSEEYDPDGMEEQDESILVSYDAMINPQWEYFYVVRAFLSYLEEQIAEDPTDDLVSSLASSLGLVISNGSTEIMNYVSNDFFNDFYKSNQSDIDKLTKAFNAKFKINSRKNQISIIPWYNRESNSDKTVINTNDCKRRAVTVNNSPNVQTNEPEAATSTENQDAFQTMIPENTGQTSSTEPLQNRSYNIFYEITKDYKSLLKFFNEKCPEATAKVTGEMIKLTTTSVDNYRKIQQLLGEQNIQFRTMDPRSERPRKVLLRGLPANTPIEDIKQVLEEMELVPITIAHLKSRKAINKGAPLPLFVVTLRMTPKFENIYSLDTINFLKVKVEKFKPQQYRQCYNCQNYGHSSLQCKLKTKCLKCAENHKAKDCPIQDQEHLKCANCGGNHPANYSGCSKHPSNKNLAPSNKSSRPVNTPRTNLATALPSFARTFNTPRSNPWEILANLQDQNNEVGEQTPTTNTGSRKNPRTRSTQAANPPPTKKANNRPPARETNNQNQNKTKDTTFQDLFAVFKDIKELFSQYNIKDLLLLLKTIMNVFSSVELELIDKISAIFEIITAYCNPLQQS